MIRSSVGSAALLLLALNALLGSGASDARAQADPIVFDGTIGPVSPGQTPFFDGANYLITNLEGEFRDTNLFYSFGRFGVPDGSTAFFFDESFQARAVIARVTGVAASEIFGAIDFQFMPAGTDFFLLNTQGVFIGPNASLNIGGDTYLATAERLRWGGDDAGSYFDSTGTDPDSVLSPTSPVAFGFLSPAPGPVGIYGADLALSNDSVLGLAGGVVEVVGTGLIKRSGDVQLAAVRGEPGELLLPLDFSELPMDGGTLGPVRLGVSGLRDDPTLPPAVTTILASLPDAPATIDVSAVGDLGPGTVVIRGQQLVMRGGEILDEAVAGDPVPDRGGYGIDVQVNDELSLDQEARVITQNVLGGTDGGAIRLAGRSVRVGAGSDVIAENNGIAPGGVILVEAQQEVAVVEGGQIVAQATGNAAAPGGDVRIRVTADDGLVLVQGPGLSGGDRVSQVAALTDAANAAGSSGNVSVAAAKVDVLDGGQLRATSLGEGDAGTIEVRAGRLLVSGVADVGETAPVSAGLFAIASAAGTGNGSAGEIDVVADEVQIDNGGRVSVSTQRSGPGGTLEIEAGRLTVGGGTSGAGSVLAETTAGGQAGNLVIRADQVELLAGGSITATTTSSGKAGDIDVTARRIRVSGRRGSGNAAAPSGIFALNTGGADAGDAGSVRIRVGEELRVDDGAEISVRSVENGIAGDVRISGGGDVRLAGGASIRATLEGDVRPAEMPDEDLTADIEITDVASISLTDATLSAETFASGQGGDIVLQATGPVLLADGSTVTARSTSMAGDAGDAGAIGVNAGTTLAVVQGSRLETSAQGGSGGRIAIAARDVVYLSSSTIATDVNQPGEGDPAGAGDVVLAEPKLAVLNRSAIVARARGSANAGNIQITTTDGFFPSDPLALSLEEAPPRASVLDATAETGIAGRIEIESPTADLVSQLTPLPANYLDASRLLATPCEARRQRRGSLTVQGRAALLPPPDALFGASAGDSAPASSTSPSASDAACPAT